MTYVIHHLLIAAAAVLAGAQLAERPWLGRAGLVLLGVHLALGCGGSSPAPAIDTGTGTAPRSGAVQGVDPAHHHAQHLRHTRFYAEELATPSRVNVGYPLPAAQPAHHRAGATVRRLPPANAAAITATGALLAGCAPPGCRGRRRSLFLFTPRAVRPRAGLSEATSCWRSPRWCS
jgi:hypothetical protein